MLKKLCISLFVVVLFSNCSTVVPNIKACSPIEGFPGVAAICQQSNTDESEELNLSAWLDFLYAQQNKGPAVCMSSEDYQKNDSVIARLCQKGRCTYSQKKAVERIRSMIIKTAPEMRYNFESLETIPEPTP